METDARRVQEVQSMIAGRPTMDTTVAQWVESVHLALVSPSDDLKIPFWDMVDEFERCEESRYRSISYMIKHNFAGYLARLLRRAKDSDPGSSVVPLSTFWMILSGSRAIGASTLYHRLTPNLRRYYGHIGYHVRPSERQKRYGTKLLAMTLTEARGIGLREVLLVCRADNPASLRVIENNGGILQNEEELPASGGKIRRYRIVL